MVRHAKVIRKVIGPAYLDASYPLQVTRCEGFLQPYPSIAQDLVVVEVACHEGLDVSSLPAQFPSRVTVDLSPPTFIIR